MDTEKKAILLEKLQANASEEALFDFIGWLDHACIDSAGEISTWPFQVLARALVAAGYQLLHAGAHSENLLRSIHSAEDFALSPDDEHWEQLYLHATQSYPFGPGEGCYSVIKIEGISGCGPGTGCRSGAGSLACLGLDNSGLMQAIATELCPWVLGQEDPIISIAR